MRGRLAPAIVAAAVVLAGCGAEATAVRGVTVTVAPPTTTTVASTSGIGSSTTTTAIATTTTTIATTTTTTTTPPGPVVDGPAAPDFAVELDNGGAFVLARQTDPTLLFFWATW